MKSKPEGFTESCSFCYSMRKGTPVPGTVVTAVSAPCTAPNTDHSLNIDAVAGFVLVVSRGRPRERFLVDLTFVGRP